MSTHEINLNDKVYNDLKNHCLETARAGRAVPVDVLLVELMDHPEVPMHYPYHHFILPAALLTLASVEEKVSAEALNEMLEKALGRAKTILGGFCGNCGACGSGVGAGIFLSVYTDTSPMSEKSWQWVNELTGRCLQRLSTVPGPRCCKRTGFLAAEEALPYINEKLGLHLTLSEKIVCKYFERNDECKREECPYYHPEEIKE